MTNQLCRSNTWWRVGLMVIRGVMLLLLVAAGVSCAPSAEESAEGGDSARDRNFADLLKTDRGIDLPDSMAIAAGHAVCSDLENGVPIGEVMSNAEEKTGLSYDDAGFLAGASISTYCPQFESSIPSGSDELLLSGLESEGIDLPDSMAIAAGHAVCSDLENGVPIGEVMSNAEEKTGLSYDDAGFLAGVAVSEYCPQFWSDFKFLLMLDEEPARIALPDSRAIAAAQAVCSDFERDVPFEDIALNVIKNIGLSPADAGFFIAVSSDAYCPHLAAQLEPGN